MSNQPVKVTVANREFNLIVPKAEEKKLLDAAEMVNKSLKGYEKLQGVNNQLEAMTLCALKLAGEILELKKQSEVSDKRHLTHIEAIETVLDKHLALH